MAADNEKVGTVPDESVKLLYNSALIDTVLSVIESDKAFACIDGILSFHFRILKVILNEPDLAMKSGST